MQCGAEHQAVRHHAEGTGGAARHAGCSGQMRPCVTARRRRQGSVGQVRECTGLAMPQHTYTQRAHNTHSPARLPVPVGRHPGLLPFGNSASAHYNYTTRRKATKDNNKRCRTTSQNKKHHNPTNNHTTPHNTTKSTAHCSGTVRQCIAGVALSTAPKRWGSALQEFHCPLKKMAPHWPCRRLRTPPGQDSPSPPGRCARFSEEDGPPLALQETPNTPWAGLPVPPRPVRPVL